MHDTHTTATCMYWISPHREAVRKSRSGLWMNDMRLYPFPTVFYLLFYVATSLRVHLARNASVGHGSCRV